MERYVKIPEGIVDSTRLPKILRINAFVANNQSTLDILNGKSENENCGLWVVPSYLNNSCFANSIRLFISDFIMIYASKDIEKDEEITISYKGSRSYKDRKQVF